MEVAKKSYPTDLTDNQWELIKDLIPAAEEQELTFPVIFLFQRGH